MIHGVVRPYLLLSSSAKEEIVAKTQLQCYHHSDSDTRSTSLYDSVVLGLAPSSFDYANLNEAFRILKGETTEPSYRHKPVPLIATHKAKYIQTESGLLSLGPGPFVTALEHATGVQATVVGKPTKKFFEMVINDFSQAEIPEGVGKGRIAIIGDDVEADLGEGALELNLWRILGKDLNDDDAYHVYFQNYGLGFDCSLSFFFFFGSMIGIWISVD